VRLCVFVGVLCMRQRRVCALQSVSYGKGGALKMTSYIDEFPFTDYIILRNVAQLPTVSILTCTANLPSMCDCRC
jgi:midasin (ATPase involved in ribosome maturation)